MKIPKKYSILLFSAIMAFFMALVMSFVMTVVNIGFKSNFPMMWIRGFAIGFVVSLPTSMLVSSKARKFVDKITREN